MKLIFIENATSWRIPEKHEQLKKNIKKIIDYIAKIPSYEMSILIVSDAEIQVYNREKRNKDKPTDVLSFPIAEDFPSPHKILGEVVISYETLIQQATKLKHTEKEEFYRLLIHGILHLLGYDHERSKKDEKIMQDLEEKCRKLIFERKNF